MRIVQSLGALYFCGSPGEALALDQLRFGHAGHLGSESEMAELSHSVSSSFPNSAFKLNFKIERLIVFERHI